MGTNQAGNQARNVVTCVASISVRFQSKEQGMSVKDLQNGSCFISRMAKTKTLFCFFLCSETKQKRLLRRLGMLEQIA